MPWLGATAKTDRCGTGTPACVCAGIALRQHRKLCRHRARTSCAGMVCGAVRQANATRDRTAGHAGTTSRAHRETRKRPRPCALDWRAGLQARPSRSNQGCSRRRRPCCLHQARYSARAQTVRDCTHSHTSDCARTGTRSQTSLAPLVGVCVAPRRVRPASTRRAHRPTCLPTADPRPSLRHT